MKKRRVGALKRLSRDKGRMFRERHLGRVAGVLPEGADGSGWTDNYIRVQMAGSDPAPDGPGVVEVKLAGLTADGMLGVVAG